jgi:hypothetical protein
MTLVGGRMSWVGRWLWENSLTTAVLATAATATGAFLFGKSVMSDLDSLSKDIQRVLAKERAHRQRWVEMRCLW